MKNDKQDDAKVIFVETLPLLNTTSSFIIQQSKPLTIIEDYCTFLDFFISEISMNQLAGKIINSYHFKYTPGSMDFFNIATSIKKVYLLEGDISVVQLMKDPDLHIYKYIQGKTYQELASLYLSKTILFNAQNIKISVQYILDWFFLWLWKRGDLLFPNTMKYNSIYTRAHSINYFLKDHFLFQAINENVALKQNIDKKSGETIVIKKSVIAGRILSSTRWKNFEDIQEKDLDTLEGYAQLKLDENKNSWRPKHYIAILNNLRWALIQAGYENIKNPAIAAGEKIKQTKTPIGKSFFIELDTSKYPNFLYLKMKMLEYIKHLENDKLAARTIKGMIYRLKRFFEFLMTTHLSQDYNESFFGTFYENLNPKIYELLGGEHDAKTTLITVARFLKYAGLMPASAIKFIPVYAKKYISTRQAMPKSMLRHLRDILVERPPITKVRWNPMKANLSWWPHKNTYPPLPLMLLFHLYIPLRGEQVRNLCRKKSLLFNDFGEVEYFVINTDKNVNRSELQKIPNVWEDLKIFKDFYKWHMEYFPIIPQKTYHDDPNTPWLKYEPLMIMPSTFMPMNYTYHKDYMYRLLAKYQIEANQQLMQEKIDPNIQIIYFKDRRPFPTDYQEIDKMTVTEIIKNLQCSYDIHSFRITGATRYLEAGLSVNLVMQLTGHTDANTLLSIYIRLTTQEKKKMLTSAVGKLFFGDDKTLVENTKRFILEEIPNNYDASNPKEISQAFEDNGLFSLFRKKDPEQYGKTKNVTGIDVALDKHPSEWFPMIHGICPGVKCPEGRERKCSLCPYLISGRLFLNGITHQANLALAKMQRLALEIEEENKSKYNNNPKSERFEVAVEEVMGWHEILQKIESNEINHSEKSHNDQNIHPSTTETMRKNKLFDLAAVPKEIAYLENAYKAFQIGAEKDSYSIAAVTIAAFNLAIHNNEIQKMMALKNKEKTLIDYVMGYYIDAKQKNNLLDFVQKLRMDYSLSIK